MASWLGFGRTPSKAPRKAADAQPAAQPGVPLELVRYNPDSGKFEVGEDALGVLRATNTPVGVVAVCGRARQGKSFILNQLLGQSSGFKVAPTVRPCTKGLWMWSAPVPRQAPDGGTYHMVRGGKPELLWGPPPTDHSCGQDPQEPPTAAHTLCLAA